MLILSLSFFNIEVCYHDISSMRTYLVEVHGTLLQTLVNLMNDYSTNLLSKFWRTFKTYPRKSSLWICVFTIYL